MAATKEIRRRIKSIKNTKKITKAMELVSAAKMRKAVGQALASRTYAQYAWFLLNSLTNSSVTQNHPFIKSRPVKNVTTVLITSDRGLCGSYNSQALKVTLKALKEKEPNVNWNFIVIGKKGLSAMQRLNQKIVATFTDLPTSPTLRETTPISKLIMNDYLDGKTDKVLVVYTDYISALKQETLIRQILPLNKEGLKDVIDRLSLENNVKEIKIKNQEFKFEPKQEKLLPYIIEKLTHMQVYQMLAESYASEQSSRMMAMKNATEAAGEMIGDLTLIYNKARQSAITQEISEISAGSAAVN